MWERPQNGVYYLLYMFTRYLLFSRVTEMKIKVDVKVESRLSLPIYTPRWREALWQKSVLRKNTVQFLSQGSNPDHHLNHDKQRSNVGRVRSSRQNFRSTKS